jgi:RimJ/RimL family protein N-acetyltransferase
MLAIHTARLVIRPFTLDDVEQIHETYSAPACGWPLAPGGVSVTLEDTARVVRLILETYETSDGLGPWAVQMREEPFVIGDCGLFRSSDDWARGELETAYRFRPASWGAGFATEAAAAVLAYAFEELGAPRVVADTRANNAASLRVLEKIGMRAVGRSDDGASIYFEASAADRGPTAGARRGNPSSRS